MERNRNMKIRTNPIFHINKFDYQFTPQGVSRGYIAPSTLRELWFHTGTRCNLSCSFCLEGSKPGDNRIEALTYDDAKGYIDEALTMGIEQFSFTGGEPFVVKDFLKILNTALNHHPCLVLTNATDPLIKKMPQIKLLLKKPNPLRIRVSLDYPDPEKHDAGRGKGNFQKALHTLGELHKAGFEVSIARQQQANEDIHAVNSSYYPYFASVGLPLTIPIIVFPDFLIPGSVNKEIPYVTENCMTQYKDEKSRAEFMCSFSRMIVKKNGVPRVYACTLVDDDSDYDMGSSLKRSMEYSVRLKHHRCFSCFAYGASCSEK
ncbi:radical SAM protein [bacterium F11]|nr:radical SAM protein [bacterium F11]